MDDQPPRRSRRSTPPAKNDSLPLVPILIGVIVLGFIIGAGLSLVGKRGDTGSQPVAFVTASPRTAQASFPPVTPAPTDPPTPAPTDVPAAVVSPDVASPAPATRAPATRAPATHAPATRTPTTPAPATQAPATPAPTDAPATKAPATKAPATPTAKPAPVVRSVATPVRPTDAPVASDDTDSEFAKLATAVVRQYVSAIARGDDATAYAAFGPDAAGSVKLVESGIIDASTHISHVEARSAGDNVTVNVDLKSPKGLYFGQYTVHRTPSGAALITDHAINRL